MGRCFLGDALLALAVVVGTYIKEGVVFAVVPAEPYIVIGRANRIIAAAEGGALSDAAEAKSTIDQYAAEAKVLRVKASPPCGSSHPSHWRVGISYLHLFRIQALTDQDVGAGALHDQLGTLAGDLHDLLHSVADCRTSR